MNKIHSFIHRAFKSVQYLRTPTEPSECQLNIVWALGKTLASEEMGWPKILLWGAEPDCSLKPSGARNCCATPNLGLARTFGNFHRDLRTNRGAERALPSRARTGSVPAAERGLDARSRRGPPDIDAQATGLVPGCIPEETCRQGDLTPRLDDSNIWHKRKSSMHDANKIYL